MNPNEEDEFFLIYGSRKRKKEIMQRRANAHAQNGRPVAGGSGVPHWWTTNPHLLWVVPTIIVIVVLAVWAMHLDAYPYWTR